MLWLLLAIVAAVELVRRLPLNAHFRDLAALGRTSAALLARRHVSDWSKGRAARILSLRMFVASLRAGLMLALVAAPIGLVLLADRPLGLGTMAALVDWRSRLIILAATIGYALTRYLVRRNSRRKRL